MTAYDKTYLEDAMENLGAMADCAVNSLGVPEAELWARFLASGIAERFSAGEPDIVCGHSGTELALMVLRETGRPDVSSDGRISISSPQYWAGWVLAYYQWNSGRSFKELSRAGLDLESVAQMFHPMHEADLSNFVNVADYIYKKNTSASWLKEARKNCGMTQGQLAEETGVPIRLIRAYEQGAIDTDHAEYRTIANLARRLHLGYK